MTYQAPHRTAVLSFIENGGSKVETARLFQVSRDTIYRWLKLDDITPKPPPRTRHRKIDKAVLRSHVQEHPDMFLRERAALFGVHTSCMGRALGKMKVRKKKSVDIPSDVL